MSDNITGLELLRQPFPKNQIGLLPKGSKAQMSCPASEKVNCKVCGGWHHPKLIHLSFVGHAALTDRLLNADPNWSWEPLAITEAGLPLFDEDGGLWIKLTVCGLTRLGYGNAEKSQYKEIGSRQKEVIGDALRNAAMRFGAALELWHKGDLHKHKEISDKLISRGQQTEINDGAAMGSKPPKFVDKTVEGWKSLINAASNKNADEYREWWNLNADDVVADCGNKAYIVKDHWIAVGKKKFANKS